MEHNYDLTKKKDLVSFMKESKSIEDWNNRCDEVKLVNGGYPDFWFETIRDAGVYSFVFENLKD